MPNNYDGIKAQKFGIEVEMTGITRAKAAKIVAQFFNTEAEHSGGSYDMYKVTDTQNRVWKIMSVITSYSIHYTKLYDLVDDCDREILVQEVVFYALNYLLRERLLKWFSFFINLMSTKLISHRRNNFF